MAFLNERKVFSRKWGICYSRLAICLDTKELHTISCPWLKIWLHLFSSLPCPWQCPGKPKQWPTFGWIGRNWNDFTWKETLENSFRTGLYQQLYTASCASIMQQSSVYSLLARTLHCCLQSAAIYTYHSSVHQLANTCKAFNKFCKSIMYMYFYDREYHHGKSGLRVFLL